MLKDIAKIAKLMENFERETKALDANMRQYFQPQFDYILDTLNVMKARVEELERQMRER